MPLSAFLANPCRQLTLCSRLLTLLNTPPLSLNPPAPPSHLPTAALIPEHGANPSYLSTRASVASSSNGSRIVAVSSAGYIYESQDFGNTWYEATTPAPFTFAVLLPHRNLPHLQLLISQGPEGELEKLDRRGRFLDGAIPVRGRESQLHLLDVDFWEKLDRVHHGGVTVVASYRVFKQVWVTALPCEIPVLDAPSSWGSS